MINKTPTYILKSATFKTSVADIAVYNEMQADSIVPEICVVGRSNVGKSSFINLITNQKKLAKTSSTPGRTRLVNMFDCLVGSKIVDTPLDNNGAFTLVDLPGYGYARAAKTEIAKWGNLIEEYFAATKNLRHVFSLVDIRHEPSVQDKQMVQWLNHYGFGFTIIATKADKIAPSQLFKYVQMVATGLQIGKDNIIPTSTLQVKGKEKTVDRIGQVLEVIQH